MPLLRAAALLLRLSFASPAENALDAFRAGDYGGALRLASAAAERGDAAAQNLLGVLYSEALGGRRDEARALRWFLAAGYQGHPAAQYNAGLMLLEGRGVRKDPAASSRWFRRSLEAAPGAGPRRGLDVLVAETGLRDAPAPAARTDAGPVVRAAAAGELSAMTRLGDLCRDGRGLRKDRVAAYRWYRSAAAAGSREALVRLLALRAGMSRGERARARRAGYFVMARRRDGSSYLAEAAP